MAIDVFWDEVEPDILRVDFSGEWTLEAQENMGEQSRALLSDKIRRSDVILYVHEGARFPRFLPPSQLRRTVRAIPENPGVRVVVGAPAIMQVVLDLFGGLLGSTMNVETLSAKSLDEARTLIHQKRTHQKDS